MKNHRREEILIFIHSETFIQYEEETEEEGTRYNKINQ
jgi:hypothetical protein